MTAWMKYGAAVLATWRVTHLLASEDGPADIIARARERLGESELGELMDCFQCTSLWVAAPMAFYVARKPSDRAVAWLALSAGACILEALISDKGESKGEVDGLLRRETAGKQGVARAAAGPASLSR
jgi:Protein of unknown function (DUF1360)